MTAYEDAVDQLRAATCAIMRIHIAKRSPAKRNRPAHTKYDIAFVGTGWCFAANLVATAHHIFAGGRPRDPTDKFFVFSVPSNGQSGYHAPVIAVHHEDPTSDMAVLEFQPTARVSLTPIPVSLSKPRDGARVVTCGFPAPVINSGSVDNSGNWLGGNLFLKSHANEGIVSAQYDIAGGYAFELNVGWHHGESGGPIVSMNASAVFAMMQVYRNIQSPHGIVAGPHLGRSLLAMESALRSHGATVV